MPEPSCRAIFCLSTVNSDQSKLAGEAQSGDVFIREVCSIEEYAACVKLQRDVFGLPDLDISPRRHLIASSRAGGCTLGAVVDDTPIGFVHHLSALGGD